MDGCLHLAGSVVHIFFLNPTAALLFIKIEKVITKLTMQHQLQQQLQQEIFTQQQQTLITERDKEPERRQVQHRNSRGSDWVNFSKCDNCCAHIRKKIIAEKTAKYN
jgi:hypothetical protein